MYEFTEIINPLSRLRVLSIVRKRVILRTLQEKENRTLSETNCNKVRKFEKR